MKNHFQSKSLHLGKRERTRSALIDSTIDVIATKGFENASIKEIARNAGMANGTFYNHFPTREHAVAEAVAAVIKEISEEIKTQVSGVVDGLDRIIISSDLMADRVLEDPAWGVLVVGALPHVGEIEVDVTANMRREIEYAASQGLVTLQCNWLLEAQILAVLSFGISVQLKQGYSKQTRAQTYEAVLRLLGCSLSDSKKRVERILTQRETEKNIQ